MKQQDSNLTTITKKNTVNLGYWTGAWMVSMALSSFGPKFLWDFNTTFSTLAIVANVLIGIGMILANKRFINGLDELQRKIQLDAMAVALGVTVVFGLGYSSLDQAKVIYANAEISHLVILTGLTYLGGVIIGQFRYK